MEEIEGIYYESFSKINFIERFEKIRKSFNDFENRMTKLDNREVKRVFNEQGYKVKIFSPGQEFYFDVFLDDYKFYFEINKKHGIILCRIEVFKKEIKIAEYTPLHFIYRVLINDMDLLLDPICYTSLDDFEAILKEFLSMYEDFKAEFLKQVGEKGIT